MNKKILVYDCETKLLFDDLKSGQGISNLGMSSCVIYKEDSDTYKLFNHFDDQVDLVCSYLTGINHVVVGYNSFHFDSKLLLGDNRQFTNHLVYNKQYKWLELDLFLEIFSALTGETDYGNLTEMLKEDKSLCLLMISQQSERRIIWLC